MAPKRATLVVLGLSALLVGCGGGGIAIPTAQATATVAPTVMAATPPPAPTPTAPAATATAAPSAATRPSLTPPTASASATRPRATGTLATTGTVAASGSPTGISHEPNGKIPQGWSVYRGTRLPFAIAYPADWSVDASGIEGGRIVFRPPGKTGVEGVIATTGKADPTANADALREQYNKEQAKECRQSGIAFTRYTIYSGITFATVGANCDIADGLSYYWIGVGLKEQVPWRFRFTSPKDTYNQNAEQIFSPMMATLNIYANP